MTAPYETCRARFELIIAETPLLADAINNGRISPLRQQLIGMFNLRNELIAALTFDSKAEAELKFLEETMGRIIAYLGDWSGVDRVASELYSQGIIDSRGEVHRIVASTYDYLDGKETGHMTVPLIGVVGPIASGKGTVGDLIASKYNGLHLPLSDRLRELAVSKGSFPPHSRDLLRQINDEIKPRFGSPVFVRWTIEMAKRLAIIYDKDVMSMDGFRSLEESQLFKDKGGVLIAVTASFETRYQRMLNRNRGADDFNRDAFVNSDEIERAWIEPIIEIADVVINNEGTVEELEATATNFLELLK